MSDSYSAAIAQLQQSLLGRPAYRCTACGAPLVDRDVAKNSVPLPGHPFPWGGCKKCGHIMRVENGKPRDLTRAEAEQFARWDRFEFVVKQRDIQIIPKLIG